MCDISTLPKYKNRPSPPRPANDLPCRGKVFIGNDGMYWKSSQTSNGVYRWVKHSDGRKSKSPSRSPVRKSKSPARKSPARKSPTRKSPARKSPTRKSKSPARGRLSSYRVYLISNRKIPVAELTKTSKVHDITLKASHFKAKAEYYKDKDKDNWEIECSETISHNPQNIKKWAKSLSGVKSVKVAHTNYL